MGLLDRIGAFDRYKVSPTQGTSGLLTGAQQPMSPFAQQAARQIGGLLGMDMRTPQERLSATVQEKGLDSPEAMQAVLANLAKIDPARAVQLANEMATKRESKELQDKQTKGARAITAYVSQLSTDDLLKPGTRSAVNELEKTYGLEAGVATQLLDTELDVRSKAAEDKEKLPVDYQNYLLAVTEDQRESLPYGEWLDRGGKEGSTELERAYQNALKAGTVPNIEGSTNQKMGLAEWKNKIWSPSESVVTLTTEQKNYRAAKDSGYSGSFTDYLAEYEGKGKTEREIEIEIQQREAAEIALNAAVELIENSGVIGSEATVANLKAGGITIQKAMESLNIDPRLQESINELSIEASSDKRAVIQRRNLLADYNANVPIGGAPGRFAQESKAFLTGADNLAKFQFAEIANETANASIPRGAASDIDVKRADRTVPTFNDSPEVIRSWLYNQMKKRALMAAEKEAMVTYMSKNRGSAAGFAESWAAQTETFDQIKKIYARYGVPPTENYVRKTVQADKSIR
jgi:hypothetical protein